jgi:hypothetical protein
MSYRPINCWPIIRGGGRPTNAARVSSSSTVPAVEYAARAREILAFWPPLRDNQCFVTDSAVSKCSIPERNAFLADLGQITSLPYGDILLESALI